jgi:hypothetical protein
MTGSPTVALDMYTNWLYNDKPAAALRIELSIALILQSKCTVNETGRTRALIHRLP